MGRIRNFFGLRGGETPEPEPKPEPKLEETTEELRKNLEKEGIKYPKRETVSKSSGEPSQHNARVGRGYQLRRITYNTDTNVPDQQNPNLHRPRHRKPEDASLGIGFSGSGSDSVSGIREDGFGGFGGGDSGGGGASSDW